MKHILNFGRLSLLVLLLLAGYSESIIAQCTTTRASKVFRNCNVKLDTTYLPQSADFNCLSDSSITQIVQVLPAQISMNGIKPCDSSYFSSIIRVWNLRIGVPGNNNVKTQQYKDTICFNQIRLSGEGDTVVCPKDTVIYCANIFPLFSGGIDTSIAALGSPLGNSIIPCNILQSGPVKTIWFYKSGGCYKFSRTWQLIDWCTSEQKTCTQLIEVRDTSKPLILTSSLILDSVSISGDLCTATFKFPPVSAIDNCTAYDQLLYSVTVNGVTINTNGGYISGLNIGTHEVLYKVDDGCGNISTFTTSIKVYDGVPPLALCKGPKVVQLPQSGMITLPKIAFDDGSFDRCTHEIGVKVRRMNELPKCTTAVNPFNRFDDNVKFCCVDAGTDVMVVVRVSQGIIPDGPVSIDYYVGKPYSECMVAVKVIDKFGPEVICPEGVTIDCRQIGLKRVKHPTDYGAAIINEMCLDNVKYDSIPNLNDCGVGYITRRITAKDKAGNSTSCDQVIKVVNNFPFNANDTNDLIWPKDTTFFVCNANTDPSNTGFPKIKDDSCAKIAFNKVDEVYEFAPGACKKILRKWSIIDWCQVDLYDPSAGKWTRIQKIVVMDTAKPVLTIPKDTVLLNTDSVCGPRLITIPLPTATDCTPAINLSWSFVIDLYSDGLDLINGLGRDASGSFPNGMHTIEFRVNDRCGNTTSRKMKITVTDGKKPIIGAISLSTDLMRMNGSGMVRLIARQFILGSTTFDNCSPFSKLRFSFSTNVNDTIRTYTCDSIGIRKVRIYATDEAGNQDWVSTTVDIQNNMNACTNPSPSPAPSLRTAGIEGSIKNETGKAIDQVSLKIMNGENAISENLVYNGKYKNEELLLGNTYDIIPRKDVNHANGVSTIDMILMQRHIMGIKALTSPYKMIAADIDRDNEITASDLIELRKLILGIDTKFSKNESWRFVNAMYAFSDLANTLKEPFEEKYKIIDMDKSMQIDFIGVKIGDVNESSLPNELMTLENRAEQTVTIQAANTHFLKNEIVKLPLTFHQLESISGLQATFKVNGLKLLKFESDYLNSNEIYSLESGETIKLLITTNRNIKTNINKPIGYLVFQSTLASNLSQSISLINDSRLESQVFDGELQSNKLRFDWSNKDFKVYQNNPNPFTDYTIINFSLPVASQVKLQIMDVNGRVVYTQKMKSTTGINQWRIEKDKLNTAGIYYYRIESSYGTHANKMILIQ